jgi:hypothetical protein
MASVFPVRGRPTMGNKWRYIKNNIVDKFNDTWTTVLWTERKESHGIRGLSHSEFAEILLHQSMNELRERRQELGFHKNTSG